MNGFSSKLVKSHGDGLSSDVHPPHTNTNTDSICLVACCGLENRVKLKNSHTPQRANYESEPDGGTAARDNRGLSIPDGTKMFFLSVTFFSPCLRQAASVSIKQL